jgi:hypothetical protein
VLKIVNDFIGFNVFSAVCESAARVATAFLQPLFQQAKQDAVEANKQIKSKHEEAVKEAAANGQPAPSSPTYLEAVAPELSMDQSLSICRDAHVMSLMPTEFSAVPGTVLANISANNIDDATRQYRVQVELAVNKEQTGSAKVFVTIDLPESHLAACLARLDHQHWVKVQPEKSATGYMVNLYNSLIEVVHNKRIKEVASVDFKGTKEVEIKKRFSCDYVTGSKWFVHKAALKLALINNGELKLQLEQQAIVEHADSGVSLSDLMGQKFRDAVLDIEQAAGHVQKKRPELALSQYTQRSFEVVHYSDETRMVTLNVEGHLALVNVPEGNEESEEARMIELIQRKENWNKYVTERAQRQAAALAAKVEAEKQNRITAIREQKAKAHQPLVASRVSEAVSAAEFESDMVELTEQELSEITLTKDECAALEKDIQPPTPLDGTEDEVEDPVITTSRMSTVEIHATFLAAAIVRMNGLWTKLHPFQDSNSHELFVLTTDHGKSFDVVHVFDEVNVKAADIMLTPQVSRKHKMESRTSSSSCSMM